MRGPQSIRRADDEATVYLVEQSYATWLVCVLLVPFLAYSVEPLEKMWDIL